MTTAGILLTGGRSRRMGTDKAALFWGGQALAERAGRILAATTSPTVEVGPGHSHLPVVPERDPGQGPLAAVAAGAAGLHEQGWLGAAVVVATDLPLLPADLLAWLAAHPSPRAVVLVDGGRPQPLCARYGDQDLRVAISLTELGRRSMRDLLEAIDPLLVGPEEWVPVAGDPCALQDVDTPEDLERIGRLRP